MSLSATLLAFATGLAARLPKPKDTPNADVEITKLKTELAHARLQNDVMRLALMQARRENVRRDLQRDTEALAQYQHGQQLAQSQMPDSWRQLGQQAQNAFDGFCNCVPSRGQVWGAMAQQNAGNQPMLRGWNDE